MINSHCISSAPRTIYHVNIQDGKANGQPLKADDYLQLGYMAGRLGFNPCGLQSMKKTEEGVLIDINSSAAPFFEQKLEKDGILFDRIA